MTDIPNPTEKPEEGHTLNAHGPDLVEKVNTALLNYSDKDWNYSRISLIIKLFDNVVGPYVLELEVLDQNTSEGRNKLKTLTDEVKWGDRHSSELGMLEVVSLRINKALLEATSNDYWNQKRPVVRVVKKQTIDRESTTHAIWYQIAEVAGEEFDNR
jgi:hypothetical protein